MTEEMEKEENSMDSFLLELSTINDYISRYGQGLGFREISLIEIHNWLRNPLANINRIQRTSRYFANRFGIVKDVNEAFKTLPSLNYHLVWSNYDNPSKIQKYEKKVYDLLDTLNVRKTVRQGLSELAEVGTVIPTNRNNKYIQFIDLDKVAIHKQVNGKWVVEVDLATITGNTVYDIYAQINNMPEEVTVEHYNLYKNKGEDYRYVALADASVLNIRGMRNHPYGLPISLSAWSTLLHKALIEQVEKSVADRKLKSLLVMYVKSILTQSEAYKPPNKDVVANYFRDLSNLLKKKDQSGSSKTTMDTAGTGLLSLPDFFELKEIEFNNDMFSKELYDKLDRDIFSSMGVSEALVYGGGTNTNYGTAQMNSEKFFRYIFTALEDWEDYFNEVIKGVLPSDLDCKIYFDRTVIGDREADIQAKKDFYLQTSIWIPYAEAVLGVPYKYALGMKEYQDKVLKLNDVIMPPMNAYTQPANASKGSDNKGGRPSKSLKDSTGSGVKAKANKSNDIPSPSD